MENNKRVLEALEKIDKIIDEIRDLFPTIKNTKITMAVKKYGDPLQTLEKISGIIVNYDESNTERKLESLLRFLGIIKRN